MKLEQIIQGVHNKESFKFEKGFIYCFDRKWDRADIKTLVEIANLLDVQGYKVKEPISQRRKRVDGMFGQYVVNEKEYEDGENGNE